MLPDFGDPGVRAPDDRPLRVAWVDVRAGVAADMLLGALLDAGAALAVVREHVAAVLPDTVLLTVREVGRAGLRATKLDVRLRVPDQPERSWADVRALIEGADLPPAVRTMALGALRQLAHAEARAHGQPADEVHVGESGSWAAVAEVVGVCAALHTLGVARLHVGEPVALGSGTVETASGALPVPVPTVLELSRGFEVAVGGDGELATATGLALLRALVSTTVEAAPLVPDRIGVGAGAADPPERANVVRVVLGRPCPRPCRHRPQRGQRGPSLAFRRPCRARAPTPATCRSRSCTSRRRSTTSTPGSGPACSRACSPRVLFDAWLAPVALRQARPGHVVATLVALGAPGERDSVEAVRDALFRLTPTYGVLARPASRWRLHRDWLPVDVAGERVRVKVGYVVRSAPEIVRATPEFDDAADLAARWGVPVGEVLDAAAAAAIAAGLVPGAPWPPATP